MYTQYITCYTLGPRPSSKPSLEIVPTKPNQVNYQQISQLILVSWLNSADWSKMICVNWLESADLTTDWNSADKSQLILVSWFEPTDWSELIEESWFESADLCKLIEVRSADFYFYGSMYFDISCLEVIFKQCCNSCNL